MDIFHFLLISKKSMSGVYREIGPIVKYNSKKP